MRTMHKVKQLGPTRRLTHWLGLWSLALTKTLRFLVTRMLNLVGQTSLRSRGRSWFEFREWLQGQQNPRFFWPRGLDTIIAATPVLSIPSVIAWNFRHLLISRFWGFHISPLVNFAILRKFCILTPFNFAFFSETHSISLSMLFNMSLNLIKQLNQQCPIKQKDVPSVYMARFVVYGWIQVMFLVVCDNTFFWQMWWQQIFGPLKLVILVQFSRGKLACSDGVRQAPGSIGICYSKTNQRDEREYAVTWLQQ